jgi:hypothetical protein
MVGSFIVSFTHYATIRQKISNLRMSEHDIDSVLEGVGESRRAALRSMLVKTAFAAPVIATFAMGGLSVREAHAYGGNLG